ncbi:DUF4184 family protein [Microbacterium pumilum]|uniref:DUF4184 family protein n=1 Tax=Microbacterium pumilum TaxID=344165 RepID=A0ABP5DYW2_9MICO
MPFTPSHAVIALPFVRTPLVPAAVAVGAMAPDLPLFVRAGGLDYAKTHDLAWLPATILLALALLLVWRCLLRPAVRELSPEWLASRFPRAWDRGSARALLDTFGIAAERRPGRPRRWHASWLGIALLLLSLAIGVVSHIVWDLFTHEGRWGAEVVPALNDRWGPLTGYKWLQHGSSVIGLVILAVWATIWLVKRDAAAAVIRVLPRWVRWAWWISLPVILAAAWLNGLAAYGPLDSDFTIAHLGYRVLPPACALWGVITLALCVVVQVVRSMRERPPRASREV